MPKVKLIYNLPEEEDELKIAQHGMDYWYVINEALQTMRNKMKWESDKMSEEEYKTYEEIRKMIWELLEERGVNNEF